MLSSNEIQKALAGTVTARTICERYGISIVTLHTWRALGLPCVVIPALGRPAVRFVEAEVRAWAAKNKPHTFNRKMKRKGK